MGLEKKTEILKFIGWWMSGIIAVLVAFGMLLRAATLDEQNKIAEKGNAQRAIESDKQNEMTEKGHIHERFKVATEHLGSEHASVRIAAFYEFYRLAELNPEVELKKTIFDILCAHLRQTTTYEDCQPIQYEYEPETIYPTEEVQSLLNILFKSDNKDNFIFDGLVAKLEGVNLKGANLINAKLQSASLFNAKLQRTLLLNANLQDTILSMADMQMAAMDNVNLQNAKINKFTAMPSGWKDKVVKNKGGKTGVVVIDDEGNVIERL